ncbi:MAG: hypothetical protein H6828_05085 [Planctomycetes bacterium]|nr:hypothetical protein [Planctomycetota bacterium]
MLHVADERAAPVERVGRALQAHPDFPRGVNVGFLAERDGAWHLRTFERGVGETEACGTNACAAAAWLRARDGRGTHELHVRGGVLRVSANEDDTLSLEGAAAWRGELLVPTRGADEGAWAT